MLRCGKLSQKPKWRNWQTRWTQNPVRFTPCGGSTPPFGTIVGKNVVFVHGGRPPPRWRQTCSTDTMRVRPYFLASSILMSWLLPQTSPAQKTGRTDESFLAGRRDSVFFLESKFFDPATATVAIISGRSLSPGREFVVDGRKGTVTLMPSVLRDEIPDSGWVGFEVSYIPAPFRFKDQYRLPAAEALEGQRSSVAAPSRTAARRENVGDWFGTGLQRNGSIMRGVTIGSNRDAALTSGFRLQLAGPLAEDVNVVAALTDENSPIQPEGTTQSLREVDKVAIDVSGRTYAVTLGDFVYSRDREAGGMFGVIERKFQGARAVMHFDALPAHAWKSEVGVVGASSGGRYHTNRFQGSEGNQGPYRLTGRYGEPRIVIIAGSERVTVNGERMTRGEIQDYVIDYGSGEITFTSRRLITAAARIVADFEYADRQYARNVVGASVSSSSPDNRVMVRGSILQESDDDNSPLEVNLDAAARDILRRSGADRLSASLSGVQYAGIDSVSGFGRGQYIRIDSVISGRVVSILRFAPGDSLALFSAAFSPVDAVPADSAGYNRIKTGEYQFAGLGKGSYMPIRFIPLPQQQRLINTEVKVQLLKGLALSAEVAGSLNDRNRLSTLDDGSSQGSASVIGITYADPDAVLGRASLGALKASYVQRTIEAEFIAPDRINDAEFERRWDLPAIRASQEVLREARVSLSPLPDIQSSATYGRVERTGDVTSDKAGIDASFDDSSSFRLAGGAERIRRTLTVSDLRSEWLRRHGNASVLSAWGRPGTRVMHEERRERLGSGGVLIAGSFRYLEIAPRIESAGSDKLTWSAEVQMRTEDSTSSGALRRAFNALTQLYEGQWTASDALSSSLSLSFRSTSFSQEFRQRGNADQRTMLVRSQTRLSPLRRGLETDIFYEFSNQRSSRLERVFARVAQGTGNYAYRGDLNGNGIADEDEFAPVRFDGDHIVLIVPGETLIPVNDVKASLRLRCAGSKFDLPLWMRSLSTETYLRVEERSTDSDASNIYALRLSGFLKQSSTLTGSQVATQDVHVNEYDPDLSMRLRVQEKRGLTQFLQNPERTYGNERSIRIRAKLGAELANQTDVAVRRDRLLSDGSNPRERDLTLQTLQSDFTYRIERQWEAGWSVGAGTAGNAHPAARGSADMNDQSVRIVYGIPGSGQLRAEIRREEVVHAAVRNGSLAQSPQFEMTEGRVAGKSWMWQVNTDLRMTDLIQVTVSYLGRKEGEGKIVHTARAEARAVF